MKEINSFSIDVIKEGFDYCVIGSGIAGMMLAYELSKDSSKSILIVESGKFELDEQLQELNEIVQTGYPQRKNFKSRIRQVGGACNLWPGRSMILNEIDFEKREWIKNSGWPIEYKELVKYYKRLKNYNFFDYDFFTKKEFYSDINDEFYEALFKDTDLDSIIAGWAKQVARFNQNSYFYKTLKARDNVTLIYNLTAKKFNLANRLVNELEAVNEKQHFIIKSKTYIIATGGIENARILMSSKIKNENLGKFFMSHPRYVRKDIKLLKKLKHTSIIEKVLKDGRIRNGARFKEGYQRENRLTNNYIEITPQYPESYEKTFSTVVQMAKIMLKKGEVKKSRFDFKDVNITRIPEIIYLFRPSELMPHSINRFYFFINRLLRRDINADSIVLTHHLEQVPDAESKITLLNEKNFLGIEKIKLNWKINDIEITTAKLLEEYMLDTLDKNNLIDKPKDLPEFERFNDASHHMGTTKMALHENDGVVDRNCKVFGTKNLYVAGSSVFPTSGHANPTYTIAALTVRLSDHLKEQ